MSAPPFGFRIVGSTWEARRLVNAAAAMAAYAACDERAQVDREAYLSAFQFGDDFRLLLNSTGSTASFAGECWAPWLWLDIDRPDLEQARRDAARLCLSLVERYAVDDDVLLLFFSGSKGFHVGLPTVLWAPEASTDFHVAARRMAEALAATAQVAIDAGVYDRVRAFRAPNSKHPKTGLHKLRLSLDELQAFDVARVCELARTPAPFELPEVPFGANRCEQAAVDWEAALTQVAQETEAKATRAARQAVDGATLNRATLQFIAEGAATGDRHRLLFSAAANLAEFGCPPALALALLMEGALDSGLPPKEARRQIECGLNAAKGAP